MQRVLTPVAYGGNRLVPLFSRQRGKGDERSDEGTRNRDRNEIEQMQLYLFRERHQRGRGIIEREMGSR